MAYIRLLDDIPNFAYVTSIPNKFLSKTIDNVLQSEAIMSQSTIRTGLGLIIHTITEPSNVRSYAVLYHRTRESFNATFKSAEFFGFHLQLQDRFGKSTFDTVLEISKCLETHVHNTTLQALNNTEIDTLLNCPSAPNMTATFHYSRGAEKRTLRLIYESQVGSTDEVKFILTNQCRWCALVNKSDDEPTTTKKFIRRRHYA
jgi:hypothetical protein